MDTKLLEDIGLTKGEITVYLTLLKTGETTTGKIIDEAQISSGKIYEILNKLIKKGLVSYIVKEKTKYFQASSPNRILDYVSEKEKDLKNKEEQIKKEIPKLIKLQKSIKKEYETTLFIGFKGIRTAAFEALEELSKDDEVLVMGIQPTKRHEKYNIMWENWHNQRLKKGIKCKLMFSEKTKYSSHFKNSNLTKIRILYGITPSAVSVLGDRVLIYTFSEENSCLSILNPQIAESFRTFFNNLWSVAK